MTVKTSRGFSLIEVIVITAIIAVCCGIIAASISSVSSSQARKCAEEMNALLSKCRICAMSRSADVYLKLYCDAKDNIIAEYIEDGVIVSQEQLGNSRAHAAYITDTRHDLSVAGTQPLCLSFKRETGALKTLLPDGITEAGQQCTAIIFSGGGRTYVIHLVPTTGMHTLEG